MTLNKIDADQEAARLSRPFEVAQLAYVGDFAVSVFLCQGGIGWHRHIDEDELFLVRNGSITLETEWGNARLGAHEMAVVPKGVLHRSSSFLRSVVLLFRPQVMSQRKNGDRRIDGAAEKSALHQVSVLQAARGSQEVDQPIEMARLDGFVLRLIAPRQGWSRQGSSEHDELVLVIEGGLVLGAENVDLALSAGDMVVIPRRYRCHLAAMEGTVALLFSQRINSRIERY